VRFPISWLLTNAAAPIQYRSIVEVAKGSVAGIPRIESLVLGFPPALELALAQHLDGSWSNTMLTVPTGQGRRFEGLGTVHAARRLLEYGWERDTPPVIQARRLLFRLLAEDEEPANAYEFAPKPSKQVDIDLLRRGRQIVREGAAMVLAQAGYENDPRLRGAARRMLERLGAYLRSPLSHKPWVRVGNKQVLAPEAAPPSIFALWTFAHMPHFRNEHHDVFDALYRHLTQAMPRQDAVQAVGEHLIEQPHLVLGDQLPHRNAVEADIPKALGWLELVARLGFLKRNENWMKMFDRFVDDTDREGVWHPHTKGAGAPVSSDPYGWALFPLEAAALGEDRWTDVTFRIGLIARLAGRPIEFV
jgi:hypothetical protein